MFIQSKTNLRHLKGFVLCDIITDIEHTWYITNLFVDSFGYILIILCEYKALLYIGSLVLAIVYYNQHISPVLRIQWLHLEWELSHQPLDWDAYISHSHINLYLCQYKNYYNQDVLSVMVIILIIIIIVFMYV